MADKKNEKLWRYEAKDKRGKLVKGEMKANGEAMLASALRRQGLMVVRISKPSIFSGAKSIGSKDISLFTRQLATMMKSGVPLLQSFEIVAKGHSNASVSRLLMDIKGDIEQGLSMSVAFGKHPQHFNRLYCNLVEAGEQAGILEQVLERLATYQEKTQAIKGQIKAALFYPAAIIVVAFIITTVIMIFVIPSFKDLFGSFGAELPAPTLIVMKISEIFVAWWWAIFGGIGGAGWLLFRWYKASISLQNTLDKWFLKIPLFGEMLTKSAIARWTRTLSTMFAAGVPLVDALESVAGAAGNFVYMSATMKIKNEVTSGVSLTTAMQDSGVFPNMVLQMVAIGEESGALDGMLGKVADFYEREVDDAVSALSSLMEPLIMAVLGVVIGGLVVAMYLPIFKMGQVVK